MAETTSPKSSDVLSDDVLSLRRQEWHLRYDNIEIEGLPKGLSFADWFKQAQATMDSQIIKTAREKILQVCIDLIDSADKKIVTITDINELRKQGKRESPSFYRTSDRSELERLIGIYGSPMENVLDMYRGAKALFDIISGDEGIERLKHDVLQKILSVYERELAIAQNTAAAEGFRHKEADYDHAYDSFADGHNTRYAKSVIPDLIYSIVKKADEIGDAQALRVYSGMLFSDIKIMIHNVKPPSHDERHSDPYGRIIGRICLAATLPQEYHENAVSLQMLLLNSVDNNILFLMPSHELNTDTRYVTSESHRVLREKTLEMLESIITDPLFVDEARQKAKELILKIMTMTLESSFETKDFNEEKESPEYKEREYLKELEKIAGKAAELGYPDIQLKMLEKIRGVYAKNIEAITNELRESQIHQADNLAKKAKLLDVQTLVDATIEEIRSRINVLASQAIALERTAEP